MNRNLRLRLILDAIQNESVIDVNQIALKCNVTPKTIRLDLQELEYAGLLNRIHGGAIKPRYQNNNTSPNTRAEHLYQKKLIAKKALSFINEGDIILLDSGSTTLELAKLLGNFNVVVLTNDLYIINELAFKDNVDLFTPGGYKQKVGDNVSLIGDDTVEFIKKYHAKKSFLSVSAIDVEKGTSIYFYGVTETKQAFINYSNERYCLVDSSKFGKIGYSKISDIDKLQNIITDKGLSEEEAKAIKNKGVNIIYA